MGKVSRSSKARGKQNTHEGRGNLYLKSVIALALQWGIQINRSTMSSSNLHRNPQLFQANEATLT